MANKPRKLRVGPASGQVYFINVFPNGEIEIRPKGARDPDATVVVTVDGVYQAALIRRSKRGRVRRTDSRDLLALQREAERKL